jgi:hypothetical protein
MHEHGWYPHYSFNFSSLPLSFQSLSIYKWHIYWNFHLPMDSGLPQFHGPGSITDTLLFNGHIKPPSPPPTFFRIWWWQLLATALLWGHHRQVCKCTVNLGLQQPLGAWLAPCIIMTWSHHIGQTSLIQPLDDFTTSLQPTPLGYIPEPWDFRPVVHQPVLPSTVNPTITCILWCID